MTLLPHDSTTHTQGEGGYFYNTIPNDTTVCLISEHTLIKQLHLTMFDQKSQLNIMISCIVLDCNRPHSGLTSLFCGQVFSLCPSLF